MILWEGANLGTPFTNGYPKNVLRVFPKIMGFPQIIHLFIGFSINYKPSILGYPYFWETPIHQLVRFHKNPTCFGSNTLNLKLIISDISIFSSSESDSKRSFFFEVHEEIEVTR